MFPGTFQKNYCEMKCRCHIVIGQKKPKNDENRQIYGYLIMDQRPFADDLTRLRTSIFPDEKELVCVYREGSN